ncbi:hypothetical protein [Burkholderia thailandensis]|uniref:Uncharacterized protein n=2 Tax=Burkholderia thailandensis TaxID=57975 RepID=Q2T4M5_BURTA|nr:hypothetical protein [Burkholderia thailandensis]ABC34496.1 hypothetical protein BTH_II1680 [Burkholderia thailandensis E264]AIP66318.2 hypothetical protein DR62_4127 [Burkholderia thailandensis]AOI55165.1 hypothetical protein WI24_25690 [Burkholderia thailandensis]AOJ48529.1 hypothetical protein WJ27_26025 [Burkholderia thailandensis]AOJ54196.1 hypothetical protein AQ475_25845 [Burkholderia thailandensis]
MAVESVIGRQGRFSLKIVGGYRPNVRKLSSWMEDCLADYACGRYRIASSLETSGRGGVAHIDVAQAGFDVDVCGRKADLLVALDVPAILDHDALLDGNTVCLVADTRDDEDGIEHALSDELRERVPKLLRKRRASGYWLPFCEEFLELEGPAFDGKLIAAQGATCKVMGINGSGGVAGFDEIT